MSEKLLVSAYLNVGDVWHQDAKVIGTCWGFQLVHNITEQIAMNNPNKSLPMVMLDDANEALAAKDARISELEKRMRPMPPSNFDLTEQEQFIRRRADEIFDENQADERADDYMYMNEEMCREAAAIEWGAMQALAAQQQAGPAEAEPFTNKEVDAIIEALEPATHSEDGMEVPDVVAWLNEEWGTVTASSVVVMDWDDSKDRVSSLMTVAQHERIVDAYRVALIQARSETPVVIYAQPARQVGDEREAFIKWITESFPNIYPAEVAAHHWDRENVSALAWQARAALAPVASQVGDEPIRDDDLVLVPRGLLGAARYAIKNKVDAPNVHGQLGEYCYGQAALAPAAVVMPSKREIAEAVQAICLRITWVNAHVAAEAAYDEIFARLNRRAIPAGLLEKAAELLKGYQQVIEGCHSSEIERFDYLPEVQGIADELRALLGKGD